MPGHELEKLLGGFAAGTLTAEERQQLYNAALHDQELFNAVADEQALKEVLTDPAVRNKLLRVLNQQGAHRSRSWLDHIMRPSRVAWAGGVAVGVCAVVLGFKVYEDSVRQSSETAALEERRSSAPASVPSTQAPAADSKSSEPPQAARTPAPAAKGPSNRALNQPKQPLASGPRNETRQLSPPPAALNRDTLDETGAPTARALFYADGTARQPMGSMVQEKDAEPERKADRFALTQTPLDKTAPVKPLAFRYRMIPENRQRESQGADDRPNLIRFIVESNQDGYIQIWRSSGESLPELILPGKETGRISLKTAAGQPQQITVEGVTDRLIVRLSRVPFGPITRQEAVMAGRAAKGQVVESVVETEDPATYVGNPDASVPDLAADISLGLR